MQYNKSIIIICFEKNKIIGGFGDRIVGLISCKLIANLLKKDFYILWTKEEIREYIDYSKYDFEKINIHLTSNKVYDYIDNQQGLKNHLLTSTKLFEDPINKFYLNQEISQYFYKNELFKHNDYFKDIYSMYKELYTDILKPTDKMISIVNNLIPTTPIKIVGIQIRTGDIYIVNNNNDTGYSVIKDPEIEINKILSFIKQDIDTVYNYYKVFITSDYEIYDLASQIWNKDKIIYFNQKVSHIDHLSLNDEFSKVFVDNYILSQKTDRLYISKYSNYGRVAALSSIHNNIFDLKTNPVELKYMLSKHEHYDN
jgi:hypothetical protein